MGRNGSGTTKPSTATRHHAAAMAGWIGPSHSPWACALECSSPSLNPSPCLLFPFSVDHHFTPATLDRNPPPNSHGQALIELSLSLFVSLCLDLGRVFLRGNCGNSGPLGSVFIGQNRPPTAWANRHDLVAEWVQHSPFAPLRPNCLQPPLSPLSC